MTTSIEQLHQNTTKLSDITKSSTSLVIGLVIDMIKSGDTSNRNALIGCMNTLSLSQMSAIELITLLSDTLNKSDSIFSDDTESYKSLIQALDKIGFTDEQITGSAEIFNIEPCAIHEIIASATK